MDYFRLTRSPCYRDVRFRDVFPRSLADFRSAFDVAFRKRSASKETAPRSDRDLSHGERLSFHLERRGAGNLRHREKQYRLPNRDAVSAPEFFPVFLRDVHGERDIQFSENTRFLNRDGLRVFRYAVALSRNPVFGMVFFLGRAESHNLRPHEGFAKTGRPSEIGCQLSRVYPAFHVHEDVLRQLARVAHLEKSARAPAMAIQRENRSVGIFSRKHFLRNGLAPFDRMSDHVDEDDLIAQLAFLFFVFFPRPGFHPVVSSRDVAGVLVVRVGDSHVISVSIWDVDFFENSISHFEIIEKKIPTGEGRDFDFTDSGLLSKPFSVRQRTTGRNTIARRTDPSKPFGIPGVRRRYGRRSCFCIAARAGPRKR